GCGELLLLRPLPRRTNEHIRSALVRLCPDIVEVRADYRCVAIQRYGGAERILRLRVPGAELTLLRPVSAGSRKHIRASRPQAVSASRSNQRRVAVHGNREPECILSRAVGCGQLCLLSPRGAGTNEHVGRALVIRRADRMIRRTDQGGIAADRRGSPI